MTSKRVLTSIFMLFVAATLTACGGGGSTGTSVTPGTLLENPPLRVASFNATDITNSLTTTANGQGLLAIAGTPVCGIDYHYIRYATIGGAPNESTTATGVLMVPTGSAASCTGPRPIVLYAHGTSTEKSFNLAAVGDMTNDAYSQSELIAAMFAAQGYIVVAPNYAGYDASPLPYHPYMNANQQSNEMIDALTAARSALGRIVAAGTTDNGKLFITGYSQGGHVAMATQRALEALGKTVTASAPMSGPYAMEAMGDAVVLGQVNLLSTVFVPMIVTSYQKSYGGLYAATTDFYEAAYATGIDSLLPSTTPLNSLFTQNKLPSLALFSSTTPVSGNATLDAALAIPSNSLYASGFGVSNLVKNSMRVAYAQDALANPDGALSTGAPLATNPIYPLRAKLKLNDMRNGGFVPKAPTLLCGGKDDPMVFFSVNTGTMQAFWAPLNLPAGLVTVLDLEAPTGGNDPFATAKAGFAQQKVAIAAQAVAAGATDGGLSAVTQIYHGQLLPPFCTAAARGFFSQF